MSDEILPSWFASEIKRRLEELHSDSDIIDQVLLDINEEENRKIRERTENRRKKLSEIYKWLRAFLCHPLIMDVFNFVNEIEIFSDRELGGSGDNFVYVSVVISDIGDIVLKKRMNFGQKTRAFIIGKVTGGLTETNDWKLSLEMINSIYATIESGQMIETIREHLRKSGFFKF